MRGPDKGAENVMTEPCNVKHCNTLMYVDYLRRFPRKNGSIYKKSFYIDVTYPRVLHNVDSSVSHCLMDALKSAVASEPVTSLSDKIIVR